MSLLTLPGFATPGQRTRGRPQRFLENPALVEPAMLAEVEALVGGVNDDRVLVQSLALR